jgi:hypothetical protein
MTPYDRYITSEEYIYGSRRTKTKVDDSDMSGSTPGDR